MKNDNNVEETPGSKFSKLDSLNFNEGVLKKKPENFWLTNLDQEENFMTMKEKDFFLGFEANTNFKKEFYLKSVLFRGETDIKTSFGVMIVVMLLKELLQILNDVVVDLDFYSFFKITWAFVLLALLLYYINSKSAKLFKIFSVILFICLNLYSFFEIWAFSLYFDIEPRT